MRSELNSEVLRHEAGSGGLRSAEELAQIVVLERLHCYNHGLPCGAAALREQLREDAVQPLPSVKWIAHVLTRYGLTHARTGWSEGEELDWLPKSAQVAPEKRCRIDMVLRRSNTMPSGDRR